MKIYSHNTVLHKYLVKKVVVLNLVVKNKRVEVINLKKVKIVILQTIYRVKMIEKIIRNSVVYLLDLH